MGSSAVVDGQLIRTSASQVQQFQACPAAWSFNYVLGIKAPQTRQQGAGEDIHTQLENYYRSLGVQLPTYGSALLLLELDIPKPSPETLPEYPANRILGIKAAEVEMIGRIDLVAPNLPRVDILDWKSTSNFKYNKTPEELIGNVQMTVYGKWAMEVLGAETVRYAHAYVGTKFKEAEVVWTPELDRAAVDAEYSAIETTVTVMKLIPSAVSQYGIEAIPGNLKHCWAYGKPCHYQAQCPTFQAAKAAKAQARTEETGGWDAAFADAPVEARPAPLTFEHEFANLISTPDAGVTDMPLDDLFKDAPRAVGVNPPDATPHPDRSPKVVEAPRVQGSVQDAMDSIHLQLFINCLPEGVSYTRLENLIAERSKPILAQAKVSSIQDVGKYGEGKKALVRSFIDNPPTGMVVASTGGVSAEVLEVLVPLAALVVRGV